MKYKLIKNIFILHRFKMNSKKSKYNEKYQYILSYERGEIYDN